MESKVAIIMGSNSDLEVMNKVADMLNTLEISYTMSIYSAHRVPDLLAEFIESINTDDSYKVIIAGAGMSAALAGDIAARTLKPVIGIPLSGGKFNGVESLLSTIEMPPGNPVLTVGVDATKNAALAAARIIALTDLKVVGKLKDFRLQQRLQIMTANKELKSKFEG